MHLSLSILREVFSYTARFLPSRYYLFLFTELPFIYLFFKSIGLWRFHFPSPCHRHLFVLLKVSYLFPLWLFHWNILFIFTESIWLLKVFFIFSFIFSMPWASMIYPPVNTGAFHGFYLFPSIFHNAMGFCASQTILQIQDVLIVFLFSFIFSNAVWYTSIEGQSAVSTQ